MSSNALTKLTQAEQWLAEAKGLDDLREIHDIAVAAEAYAKAHRLGLAAENHAMEVRLMAARRIGELVPPQKTGPKGEEFVQTSDKLDIPKQRLSDFRKLAAIPEPEFKARIEAVKGKEEKLSYVTFIEKPHVAANSGENEWYTKPDIIEIARTVMGTIDLDPASTAEANEIVKATQYFTKETDGVSKEWHGNVWLNPPYAQPIIGRFCDKIITEVKAERVRQAMLLVNNATETLWFQSLMSISKAVCFPKGRDMFWYPGRVSAPLQGQAIIYSGENVAKFAKSCKPLGIVLWV